MADTVAVMNKGAIEQMGAPAELYELPRTVVRRELPRPVEPVHRRGRRHDERGDHRRRRRVRASSCRPRARSGTRARSRSACAPRRSRCTARRRPRSPDRNVLGPGRVIDVSFSGVSTQYLVDVPGAGAVLVFAQNIGVGPGRRRRRRGLGELGGRARLRPRRRAGRDRPVPGRRLDDRRSPRSGAKPSSSELEER